MPHYFFHQQTERGRVEDLEGSAYADLAAAREEALTAARHLWAEAIVQQRDLCSDCFEISDAYGRVLLVLPFIDALPERLRRRLRP